MRATPELVASHFWLNSSQLATKLAIGQWNRDGHDAGLSLGSGNAQDLRQKIEEATQAWYLHLVNSFPASILSHQHP